MENKSVDVPGKKKNVCLEYSIKKLKQRIPIIDWLPKYQWKNYFIFDFLAGLSIACICVPQGLAFAILANVDSIYGLYTCCFPAFLYGIFGTASYSSFGASALTSLLVGESVIRFDYEQTEFSKSEYVATLTTLIGLYYFFFFFFRLYFVIVAFRTPFVCGFLTAIVFNIMVKSLGPMLGISQYKTFTGVLNIVYTTKSLFSHIKSTNFPTLFLSIVILSIYTLNYFIFAPWFKKKTSMVFPIETLMMMLAILFSYIFGFSRYGISLVGHVPTGLPQLTVPNLSAFHAAWFDGMTIAAVNYAATITNLVWFNDKLDNEQEVWAIAVANLMCAWIQCFAIGNSMMRAMVAWSVGLKTLLAQIICSFFMMFIAAFAGPMFGPLPNAVLGCIMFTAATKLLYIRVKEVKKFYKSYEDMFIYLITFWTTLLTTIEMGLFIGLIFSLRKILEEQAKWEEEEKQAKNNQKQRETAITIISEEIPENMGREERPSIEEKRKSSKSLMKVLGGQEKTEEKQNIKLH